MARVGFFTRKDARDVRKKVRTRTEISDESLRRLGTAGVENMNRDARHPAMKPHGCLDDALVYVLGECPGEEDDHKGKAFSSQSGRVLSNIIPDWALDLTTFDYCVRTFPPKARKPEHQEIECFREVVTKSIERAKPEVILGVGPIALTWATGLTKIKVCRGKRFPVKIGNHSCWFIPVLHPSFLKTIEKRREDKVAGSEWARTWEHDVDLAFSFAQMISGHPDKRARVIDVDEARKGIQKCLTLEEVFDALDDLSNADCVGWDIETYRLRPYYADARVLSIALSDGERTYAFAIDHDQAGWSPRARKQIIERLRQFFVMGPRKVAHNSPFDMEWMLELLGEDILQCWMDHDDTMQAAFVIDPGPPGTGREGEDERGAAGHSLNDLCIHYYGLALKSLSPDAKEKSRLRELALPKLLDYNGLDAKWTQRLFVDHLEPQVRALKLQQSYRRQMDRIPAVLMAQRTGIPTDQKETRRLQVELEGQISGLEKKLIEREEISEYERTFGKFNAGSPQDVAKLLLKVMKLPVPNTNAKTLEEYRARYPVIQHVLDMRGLHKQKGVYVDRFLPDHKESFVFPDGLTHCRFGITTTRTARFSSEDPNHQNWPKRKNKHIRKQLAAPKGWAFVSCDQGQIEARVLAMESRDPTWVRMIFEDYDVHTEWAEKLAEIDPDFMDRHGGDKKKARHSSKNGWVFPAFFGSSIGSIVRNLQLPEQRAEKLFKEFWRTFKGVKEWQQEKWERYQKDYFVTSLTGRRRLAPLSFNMVINTPIQNVASDICVDAMVRLSDLSRREKLPWLQPRLQVHDDLTFLMPVNELEDGVSTVVREQLGFQAEWLNVPLMVEVEVGDNLFEMQSIGSWRSDRI